MAAPFSRTTRALAHDSGGPALWRWAIAAGVLATWSAWLVLGRITLWEVSTQARLEAAQGSHAVSVRRPSRIVSNLLVLGSTVRAGEVLVTLDSSTEQLQLHEAQAGLAALAPQITALQAEILAQQQAAQQDSLSTQASQAAAQARLAEGAAGLAFATDQARRLRDDSVAGSVPLVDALAAQAQHEKLAAAQAALVADRHRLASDAQARAHQQRAQVNALQRSLAALQGARNSGRSTLAQLQAVVDQHTVLAPVDGRVADVAPLHPGDMVAAGQHLATLLPPGALRVVARFDPAAVLGRLQPGQPARLKLDGFPWARHGSLALSVSQVSGELQDQQIRVELTPLPGAQAGLADVVLQHGLPGTVEVAVGQVSPAALVLRAAGQRLGAPATGHAANSPHANLATAR